MMENSRLKEENFITDIGNLFRLKKQQNDTAIKEIRNLLFRMKKKKGIKYIVLRTIKKLSEYKKEKENYYKPVKVNTFWNNNYIDYKSNGDKNKTVSAEEYLNKIGLFLRDLLNDLKQSESWKIQVTMTINFISSKDYNDEDRVMHSRSDNIETLSINEAIIKKPFDSLKNRYQNNLESMRGNEFVFNYVQLLYYKCNKKNLKQQ